MIIYSSEISSSVSSGKFVTSVAHMESSVVSKMISKPLF